MVVSRVCIVLVHVLLSVALIIRLVIGKIYILAVFLVYWY